MGHSLSGMTIDRYGEKRRAAYPRLCAIPLTREARKKAVEPSRAIEAEYDTAISRYEDLGSKLATIAMRTIYR